MMLGAAVGAQRERGDYLGYVLWSNSLAAAYNEAGTKVPVLRGLQPASERESKFGHRTFSSR